MYPYAYDHTMEVKTSTLKIIERIVFHIVLHSTTMKQDLKRAPKREYTQYNDMH